MKQNLKLKKILLYREDEQFLKSAIVNAQKLNEIGEKLAIEYNVPWLVSDFKKKNGYKRSIELSAEYDLYRQDYCGCGFSKAESLRRALKSTD